MSYSNTMLATGARGVAQGGVWGLGLVLLGCVPEDGECLRMEASGIWDAAAATRLCLTGDLIVMGRGPDDIAVLERVEEIDGALIFHDNPAVVQLPELTALVRIGGALSISANAQLTEIGGFPNLEEVGGRIYVAENPELTTAMLGSGIVDASTIFIALNPKLDKLGGLQALNNIRVDLRLQANDSLVALELPMLTNVTGDLVVTNNQALRQLEFPELRTVAGTWSVSDNGALESLSGFPKLELLGDAYIERNDSLEQVTWSTAFVVKGVLSILENVSLRGISATDTVRLDPGTHVRISENPQLLEIRGFLGVKSLGSLALKDNAELRALSGLDNLTRVTGRLEVVRNVKFEASPEWLPALTAVSEAWVFGNDSLGLASIGGLLAHVALDELARVGDNQGEETALDPCPWPTDGVCDAIGSGTRPGTELCAADPEDCDF